MSRDARRRQWNIAGVANVKRHHLFLNNSFVLGMIIYLSSFPFAWKIARFSTSAPSFVLQRWSVASNRFETH